MHKIGNVLYRNVTRITKQEINQSKTDIIRYRGANGKSIPIDPGVEYGFCLSNHVCFPSLQRICKTWP